MREELKRKVKFAISLIRSAAKKAEQVGQPLEICYSGGKDSDVILELAKMAGVNYRAIYKNTTIDPPGTIKHVKEMNVEIKQPQITFKQLVENKGIPSRFARFCCESLKEYKILDYAVVGVRKDESINRNKRYKEPEICRVYKNKEKARIYMPILNFTKDDVVDFIKERGITCHPLYYDEEKQFHVERRLGCLGCPVASKKARINDFLRYPKLIKLYINGSQKFLNSHANARMHDYFDNAYQWFTYGLFCDSISEFRERFGKNLFDDEIDCKKFLEDYFHVNLDFNATLEK